MSEVTGHMNVFRPYRSLPEHHEDQMTRAALLVLRLVPLALEAFLDTARATLFSLDGEYAERLPGVSSLGAPVRVATQSSRLREASASDGDDEDHEFETLLSVFLTPDENRAFSEKEVVESTRGQRLDGVIEFASRVIIAIESKIDGHMPSDQAEYINLGGLKAERRPVIHIGWQDFFERLMELSESGLLAPAERELIDDLFSFGEEVERFDRLLPFSKLRRCEGSDYRIKRRLRSILADATGFEETTTWDHGWNFAIADGVTCSEVSLLRQGDGISLMVWPGQKAAQSRELLRRAKELRSIDERTSPPAAQRDQSAGWRSGVSLHVGYYRSHRDLNPDAGYGLGVYADHAKELEPMVGRRPHDAFDSGVRRRLIVMGLATSDDESTFEWAMGRTAQPIFRAAAWIARTWEWDLAVELDEDDRLVPAIAEAAAELFGALGEVGAESSVREEMIRSHS